MHNEWTPLASLTAHLLAEAFGHGWAAWAVFHEDGSLDLEATEDAQREGESSGMPGLRPALAHTTGSGRLRWRVAHNGTATITVTRPPSALTPLAAGIPGEVVVAQATVTRDEPVMSVRPYWAAEHAPSVEIGDHWVAVDVIGELCEERHLAALGQAIFAIVDRDLVTHHEILSTRLRDDESHGWLLETWAKVDGIEFWLRSESAVYANDARRPGIGDRVSYAGKLGIVDGIADYLPRVVLDNGSAPSSHLPQDLELVLATEAA